MACRDMGGHLRSNVRFARIFALRPVIPNAPTWQALDRPHSRTPGDVYMIRCTFRLRGYGQTFGQQCATYLQIRTKAQLRRVCIAEVKAEPLTDGTRKSNLKAIAAARRYF